MPQLGLPCGKIVGNRRRSFLGDIGPTSKITSVTATTTTTTTTTRVRKSRDVSKGTMAAPPTIHPFQLILQEHARFMMAIKDLQSQVQALQEFRFRVCQAFPHLDTGPLPHPVKPTRTMASNHPGGPPADTAIPTKKTTTTSKTGARVLPSVHQVSPPSTPGRHVVLKPHQSSFGRDRREMLPAGAKGATSGSSRGRHHLHHSDRAATGDPAGGWSGSNKKFIVVAQGKNWLRIRPCAGKTGSGSEDSDDEHNSMSDSLHSMTDKRKLRAGTVTTTNRKVDGATTTTVGLRQDSGFSTDGKERLKGDHESGTSSDVRWSKMSGSAEDELMALLEAIGQKSLVLRRQADTIVRPASSYGPGLTLSDIGLKPDDVLAEMDRLRLEKEQMLERLVSVESEKELYRGEMEQLRDVLLETETVRRQLEERLEVHRLSKGGGSGGASRDFPVMPTSAQIVFNGSSSLPDRLGRSASKLKVRMDKAKISAILRETRSLELQRQLLVAVLRNEVLKTQLEHGLGEWRERAREWRRAEMSLLNESDMLQRANDELQVRLQRTETDLKLERSKRQVLERALQAAYKDLTTNNSASTGARDFFASSVAADHQRQISADAFGAHQVALSNGNSVDKSSDVSTTSTLKSSSGQGTSSPGSSTPANTTITMASSIYNKELAYRRLGHAESTPRRDSNDITPTRPDDQPKGDVTGPFGGPTRGGPTDDGHRPAATSSPATGATTVTFKTVQPGSGSGNVTVRIVNPATSAAARQQQQLQPTTRYVAPARSDRLTGAEVKLMKPTSSYTSGLSPKNRNKIFISKCSQSAEDLRNSDWEWTYDIKRSSAQHLNMAQHMVITEAMT